MKSNPRGNRPLVQRVSAAMPVGLPASPRPPPRPPPAPGAPAAPPAGAAAPAAPPPAAAAPPPAPAAAGSPPRPRPPPAPPPRCGSGIVARSMLSSFAFQMTYESNAAADSTPSPPPPGAGRAARSVNFAPISRSESTNSLGAPGSNPIRNVEILMLRSNSNGIMTVDGSRGSTPWIALNTIAQSSTVRQIGPTRSCDQARTMPPVRLTRPKVGRSALNPHSRAGETIDPDVSVPMPNATHPDAVADEGPAEDPLEPRRMSHGLLVRPRYHWSPCANNPVASFAISTAPALRSRTTISASSSMMRFSKSFDPQVVRTPLVENRSFTPYGMPC